ncbi:hypothetical protein F0L17_16885 [Streptomyces sp. TRM43335]|uniref:Uncharacterized protein n=1 Tax=Streptomyces taklimakanensis TaxID=2569853 RepID=A0A6G2BF49_9ACTN|nr:hypothetical protein [Streptomyces taklimakanensis]MTE20756.1 hypothetical protein [Streptomyces taklimakanensis]
MVQRTAAVPPLRPPPAAPPPWGRRAVRALLAVAALLAGVLAPALSGGQAGASPRPHPHPVPHTGVRGGPHVVGAPCAVGCDRTPLLYRDATGERHASHPAGAAVPPRAPLPRPAAGTRPSAFLPDPAVRLRHTALQQGRAPPLRPGG